MGLGIASSIFTLCFLFVFLIAQNSGARKIPTTTGREIQLNEVSHDLKQLATEGDIDILTNIMQLDGADVEVNNKQVKKDDDEDEHKKLKGKYVKEEEDDDSDDEDDDDDEDEDDDDDDDDVDDDDKKKTGNQANHKDDDDDDDDDDKKTGKQVDKDEHRKITGKNVNVHKPCHIDHNHMDTELDVFFTPSDLKVGKTMPINFAKKNSSTSSKFLPREEADQIPFSSKQLPSLLKFFSFSKHSPQAKAMKHTLKQCEFEPREGETKFCATSLKALLDFARYLFGSNVQFKALTTTHLTDSTVLSQNYTISEVKEISVPNIIRCHLMPYPYAVFYCHIQGRDTNVYEVLVEGQNGGRVQAAAICHVDTSKWDPDHFSFRVVNVEPGTSPLCHFFPPDNLVLVPLPSAL